MKKFKKKYKHLTAQEYADIKTILAIGATHKLASAFSKRTRATIERIAKSADFDEYKVITKKMNSRYGQDKKLDPKPEATVTITTDPLENISIMLDEIIATMNEIQHMAEKNSELINQTLDAYSYAMTEQIERKGRRWL
jgi:hypothetical protein